MDHENPIAQSSDRHSQLFMVRLWREPTKNDRPEIRGKVQHVLTGEVQYFREWAALTAFMTAQIDAGDDDTTA